MRRIAKILMFSDRAETPAAPLARLNLPGGKILPRAGAPRCSLYVALNTAVSGLFNQRAIAATSENIANVNTPNFARRESHFQTDAIPNQFSGVDVEIVRAAVDRFLQGASYGGTADAAASKAIAEALSRVEASLGAPGDNISYANKLDEAFAALTQLSANPSSAAAKADALLALQAAFDAFGRTGAAINAESDSALGGLNADIGRVNTLLDEIYRLNQVVRDSAGAADLLDQRLAELSTYLSIDVTRTDDGRVEVALRDGTVLANSGGFTALGVASGPPTAITLSTVELDDGEALVRMSTYFFGLYKASAHLAQQVSFEDYARIFETIWKDRARAAGWSLDIEYGNEGYRASTCLLRFKKPT